MKIYVLVIFSWRIFDRVNNMEKLEKQQWIAEVKALKAYCYFELLRHYGPIVLMPESIPADADISIM